MSRTIKAPLRAVVFDLDNTLVISASTDEHVLQILRQHEAAPSRIALLELITAATSDWQIVSQCLPPPERISAYREILKVNSDLAAASTCRPEVRRCLASLASRYQLFIATGRDAVSTRLILRIHGLREYFSDIAAASERSLSKPDGTVLTELLRRHGISPAEALYVGDRMEDHQLAQQAGAAFLGAAWYVDRLAGFPAAVRSAAELLTAIAAIA